MQFTPEALAIMRRRYLETDESISNIARDFDISKQTLMRIAQRENWPARTTKIRGLPSHMVAEIEAESAARMEIRNDGEDQPLDGEAQPLDGEARPLSVADRLERAVGKELDALERRRTGSLPGDADRTARILDRLTAILSKIRNLRASDAAESKPAPSYDDLPENIDEFRIGLARRIEAFVKSRTEEAPAPEQTSSFESNSVSR
jgi:transposase-like protein